MSPLRLSPLFAAMSVACGATPADGQSTPPGVAPTAETPALTVRGNAELQKPADQLQITIGVVTDAEEASEALEANTDRMTAVVAAIKKVGLAKNEYKTGRFQIQPVYSRRPRSADTDWRPTIVAYQVTNSINVRTKQIDLAGPLIERAHTAGANSVDNIRFDLADNRTHRAEAIQTATRHALDDARVLAEAAGLRLVRILSINLDDTPRPIARQYQTAARAMSADSGGAPPPMAPGEITVRAAVTVVYEIASSD